MVVDPTVVPTNVRVRFQIFKIPSCTCLCNLLKALLEAFWDTLESPWERLRDVSACSDAFSRSAKGWGGKVWNEPSGGLSVLDGVT